MFVALGDASAVHDAQGAFFHATVASGGHDSRAIGARDHFVTGAAAVLAVLKSHRDERIRSRGADGKAHRM
jgi:hypothetical protein